MAETRSEFRILLSRCFWLAVVTLGLWAVLYWPARLLGGRDGIDGLTISALLCAVPGWLVFAAASRFRNAGAQVPFIVLGGSALRLLFVLIGVFVVQAVREDLSFREFTLWLLVFYLGTLATETMLMLKSQPATSDTSSSSEQPA